MTPFYRKPHAARGILLGGLAVLTALVVLGSLMPEGTKVAMGTASRLYVIEIAGHGAAVNPHRVVHFVAFGSMALLSASLARTAVLRLVVAAGIFLIAFALEMAQHLVFSNMLEWADIADDLKAIVIASALVQAAVFFKRKRVSGSV